MIAGASLTVAAIYGLVWLRHRTAWAHLLFALTAASLAAFTFCELWVMRAESAEELLAAAKWAQLPLFFILVSITWLVAIYLRAGRLWLAWTACGMRLGFVLLNFLGAQNINIREVPSLRRVRFLGESVTVLVGVPNPVMLFGQLAVVLILVFVADASVTAWRRGDRLKALMVGGSVEFFLLTGLLTSAAVIWAHVEAPIVLSLLYLGLVAVMGYELSRDVRRASQLVGELQASEAGLRESEQRFRLMADTAPVLIWLAGPDRRYFFFNQRWLEFRRRTVDEEAGDGWTEGIHPEDATRCWNTYAEAFAARQPFHREYRFRRFDGEYCWMRDTGVPRVGPDGSFAGYIGSSIEITDMKRAERDARENQARLEASHKQISDVLGRLISAQETERTRIARDLHDDVSQRIAALSMMISAIKRRLRGDSDILPALISVQQSTAALGENIRHFSHDLHPILLQHAGLGAALRVLCAEFEKLHAIEVTCTADADPQAIAADTALCLYRIAQEALRNVAKHADAHHVAVTVTHASGGVQLSIVDDGKGFDLAAVRGTAAGLGLVSIDERARLLGGRVRIDTQPQNGTRVHVELPGAAERFASSALSRSPRRCSRLYTWARDRDRLQRSCYQDVACSAPLP